MGLTRLMILFLLVISWASSSKAQTSGGGPFTHSNVSFCDLGSGICAYPYRINVTTGSIYNPGTGVVNITTGSSGTSSQWTTINTNDVFLPNQGNVGIGTNLTTGAALTVMNGNVGIGTWLPTAMVEIAANPNNAWMFRVDNNLTAGVPSAIVSASGSNIDNGIVGSNGGNTWGDAQVFTTLATYTITGATRSLAGNVGSPSGTMTCSINITSAGTPTLVLADSNLTSAFTPTGSANNTITFNGSALLSAGTYALVCLQTVPGSGNNYWRTNSVAGTGLYFSTSNGASWTSAGAESGSYSVLGYAPGGMSVTPFEVYQNGNVAVGTTAIPGAQLDVNGTVRATGGFINGNLGIGTATPGQQLDINGSARILGTGSQYFGSDNSVSQSATAATNGGWAEFTNGIQRLGATLAGNVGINTSNPGQLLDVLGSVRIAGGNLLSSQGTAPTVANNDCGSTSQGTVSASSTDFRGDVIVGTLAVTSCKITFAKAHPGLRCFPTDDTSLLTIRATETTTTATFVSASSVSGDTISYFCLE